jgi:hypothetical protein
MARVTSDEMWKRGACPLDVYDANGMPVLRSITAFDAEAGEVESEVWDLAGNVVTEGGRISTRVEKYPAPLSWRKISSEQAVRRRKEYWDLRGR